MGLLPPHKMLAATWKRQALLWNGGPFDYNAVVIDPDVVLGAGQVRDHVCLYGKGHFQREAFPSLGVDEEGVCLSDAVVAESVGGAAVVKIGMPKPSAGDAEEEAVGRGAL